MPMPRPPWPWAPRRRLGWRAWTATRPRSSASRAGAGRRRASNGSRGSSWARARRRPADYEVLGLRVVADDGGGGLLGVKLPRRLLAALPADALGPDQPGTNGVVLQVRAGRVAPGVPASPVLLTEEPLHAGPVVGGVTPLVAYAPVP